MNPSIKRHIAKTFTWRAVGTIDTILLGWIVSGNLKIGFSIGGLELITKMGLYFLHERVWYRSNFGLIKRENHSNKNKGGTNLTHQTLTINRENRNNLNQHKSFLIWFTGLSGSGKSTLANHLEQVLNERGLHTYLLDGDNIRSGLNSDLSFSSKDRHENIRRIGEVSNLMVDSGLITLAAFISPFNEDRKLVQSIVGSENYIEIYISTPLEECIKRDTKGLYKKALNGEILNFTGVSSPYEEPTNPDLTIDTSTKSIEEATRQIIALIESKI